MNDTKNRLMHIKFITVVGFFLLSGFSSLIYQVIWTRLLVFVFGSTTFATSTVLAVFMGGLALGSFLSGRFVHKIKNQFLYYGVLEGIIGIWAILAPYLFQSTIPIYKAFFDELHNHIIIFGLLRFLVVSLILLIPTSCMGATLPLLSKFVTERISEVGDKVGNLYAINTLGAVLGAITAGFILIPQIGLSATTISAASVNIGLAISVFCLSKFMPPDKTRSKAIEESESMAMPHERMPREVLVIMLSFAISGGLAMIYEVAWTRSLLMVVGSTTYAFTVMLSTFLIGIFLGSFLCARVVDRLKHPILWFGTVQICLCLAGFLSLILFNYLPDLNISFANLLGKDPFFIMLARFVAAGGIMVPITFCLGIIFPLAVRICTRDLKTLGRSVGDLYAANTFGAIAGAFLAGFLIIPLIGTEQTLAFAAITNALVGLIILTFFGGLRKTAGYSAMVCIAIASIYLAIHGIHVWDIVSIIYAQSERRLLVSTGTTDSKFNDKWLETEPILSKETLKSVPDLLFYKEGPCANVAVTEASTPALGKIRTLFTNGHADASDSLDMENQAMLAAFPLLLRKMTEDVCVIGWGSGVTSGYALRFPIQTLVTSEIEPVVVETSPLFHHVNFSPEHDQRAKVEPSDGRNFLLGTNKKFDVIISEPSNPWQAGVCNLFTREYFMTCADSLKEGGMFTMWSQVNEIPTKNLVQVYAALANVFPQVFVLDSGTGDTIALASKQAVKISIDELRRNLALAEVRKAMLKFGISSPEDFISRICICPSGIEKAVAGSAMNTDDRNYLEYDLSKSYESKIYTRENDEWFLKNAGPIWNYIEWGTMTNSQKANEMLKIAESCVSRSPDRTMYWAEESMRLKPSADALSLMIQVRMLNNDLAAASLLSEGNKRFPSDARMIGLSGILALRKNDYSEARYLLNKALALNPSNYSFRYFLAATYSPLNLGENSGIYKPPGDVDANKVIELCSSLCANPVFIRSKPGAILMLAEAYKTLGQYQRAIDVLTPLARSHPNIFLSWQLLGEAYAGLNQEQSAISCRNKAAALANYEIPMLALKAKLALARKNETEALRRLQHILLLSPTNAFAMEKLNELAKHNDNAEYLRDSMVKSTNGN